MDRGGRADFSNVLVSLKKIPVGKKSAALSRPIGFWCKFGVFVCGGFVPVDKLPP